MIQGDFPGLEFSRKKNPGLSKRRGNPEVNADPAVEEASQIYI